MRYAVALLTLALISCARAPVRAPAAGKAYVVNCAPTKVPRYLYHFGAKKYLDRDVEARTVPDADWREAIMGENTTWSLPRFRRGLYGTERALRADPFVNHADPAFIRITVAESCRNPARVATTVGLTNDPRFQKWAGPAGAAAFLADCAKPDGTLRGREYAKFEREPPSATTLACEAKVENYFQAIGARVVQDSAVAASWYLRDRSCVETIEGTDSEVLRFFSEPDFFAPDECGAPTGSLSTFRIFVRTVLRKNPSPSDLFGAFENWRSARLDSPPTTVWIRAFADAYARCRSLGRVAELERQFARFDSEIAGIRNYEFETHLDGEEPDPHFGSVCR